MRTAGSISTASIRPKRGSPRRRVAPATWILGGTSLAAVVVAALSWPRTPPRAGPFLRAQAPAHLPAPPLRERIGANAERSAELQPAQTTPEAVAQTASASVGAEPDAETEAALPPAHDDSDPTPRPEDRLVNGTPRAAARAVNVYLQRGDIRHAASLLCFDASEQSRLEALLDTLPEHVRERYGSAATFAAFMLAGSPVARPAGELVAEKAVDDRTFVQVMAYSSAAGEPAEESIVFVRDAGGWRQRVSPELVDRMIAYLRGPD